MAEKDLSKDSKSLAAEDWERVLAIAWGKSSPEKPLPVRVVAPVVNQQPVVTQAVTSPQKIQPKIKIITQESTTVEKPTSQPKEIDMAQWSVSKRIFLSIGLLIGLFVSYALLDGVTYLGADAKIEYQKKVDAQKISHAKSNFEVAQIQKNINNLQVQKVATTPLAVSTGPVYNCNSIESYRAGFKQGTVQSLPSSGKMTVTGCLWLSAVEDLEFSGSDYRIEVPASSSTSFACSSVGNQDCGEFYKGYRGKSFRVLTLEGGSVNITKKGV